MVGPAAKRAIVKELVQRGRCSERRACGLVEAPRMSVRYTRQVRSDEAALRKRIRQLAQRNKRYGVRRILAKLRREAWRVNRKRVHRISRSILSLRLVHNSGAGHLRYWTLRT